ncbi:5382_t:CDS:2 [Gigaspora margarita]|uniref:5382_t:CDS:1 n=1 Tax=Gigaspora margarita TaxID=4874 RepID=A0ABN7W881_GIGMA|nr:5382_t:CDS:2 [Gigaspora margarita]
MPHQPRTDPRHPPIKTDTRVHIMRKNKGTTGRKHYTKMGLENLRGTSSITNMERKQKRDPEERQIYALAEKHYQLYLVNGNQEKRIQAHSGGTWEN